MHKERMRQIGSILAPKKGTPEYEDLIYRIKNLKKNKKYKNKLQHLYRQAIANSEIQKTNGAGLPADELLREYNAEYNNRSINHSLHQLPGSFNTVEAFNIFTAPLAVFEIRQEIDALFSFNDFIDFITSDQFDSKSVIIEDFFDENIIYSFNSVDNPSEFLFSTKDHRQFGIRSISLIRHKNEITIAMLAGEDCNLEEETEKLKSELKGFIRINEINPDPEKPIEAVPLIKGTNLWRTIVLARIDIETCTIDARYIYRDAGQSYQGQTDDLDCYIDMPDDIKEKYMEKALLNGREEMEKCEPLFELCKSSIFLPLFRESFEDTISIERHPTAYSENRKKTSFRKINEISSKHLKVSYRQVENIKPSNRNITTVKQFTAPNIKIETSGYWKKLEFQESGLDKNNRPVQGRTWVRKTLEWAEPHNSESPTTTSINEYSSDTDNKLSGYVYVFRNASHQKDIFKVGQTERTPEIRAAELSSSTGSADQFLVVDYWFTKNRILLERIIHHKLDSYRFNKKREFFKIDYKTLHSVILDSLNELKKQQTAT